METTFDRHAKLTLTSSFDSEIEHPSAIRPSNIKFQVNKRVFQDQIEDLIENSE
jgi:hypothetical protein